MRVTTASASLAVLLSVPAFGETAAGTVSGHVQVEGNKALSSIIVYLESPNGTRTGQAHAKRRVSQKGREFAPDRVVLVQGGEVAFVNDEEKEIDHNVFSLSEVRKFDIGLARRGSVKEVTFPEAGEVKYYCSVHKNMEGVVVVVPTPYFASADDSGGFRIENVPPGEWLVKAYVAHHRYSSEPVPVSISEVPLEGLVVSVMKKKRGKQGGTP
jgi:plastocyanin